MTSAKRDIDRYRRAAIHAGWRIVRRGGHERWYPADKEYPPFTVGTTPSDSRAILNLRAGLRRRGLDV